MRREHSRERAAPMSAGYARLSNKLNQHETRLLILPDNTAKTQHSEDHVWPEVAIRARLDALAGLVLQTGAAVLIGAMSFGLQAHHFDPRHPLPR